MDVVSQSNAGSLSLLFLVLVGDYFAYGTTSAGSELLLRGHECRGLLVETLELVELAQLGGNGRELVLLGALDLDLLQFFLGGNGLSDFNSQELTAVALFPEAVVDVVAVQTNPVPNSLGRLFGLDKVVLGLADSREFVDGSVGQILDLLTSVGLFSLSVLLVGLSAA